MDVQVFGVKNDADTRKALRFFKERRIKVHFVDFKIRGPSKGELRRFSDKYGMDALVDRDAKRFQELGLRRPTTASTAGSRSPWTSRASYAYLWCAADRT